MAADQQTMEKGGLPAALGAYLIWGFLPLYLMFVSAVPPFEFVGWRIIWTVPICLVIVAMRNQFPAVREALGSRKTVLFLAISASLIGINWFIYVWAIQNERVFASSLGYYINPIINVLLGTVLLKEKLSRLQWLAVGIAGVGVALLALGALDTLWISLTLALSFALYGLVRKQVDVGALPGLTIEAGLLLPPSLAIVWSYSGGGAASSFGNDLTLSLLIILGGILTALPLLLFAIAARRMPYSTLGFIQYMAPTIVFLLGLFVFKEELRPVQLACFVLIWIAVALFVWDLWSRSRRAA